MCDFQCDYRVCTRPFLSSLIVPYSGLGTGDNHLPPRLGLQLNPGASGRAVGSSVSSMLAESNRPTDYSKYTTP